MSPDDLLFNLQVLAQGSRVLHASPAGPNCSRTRGQVAAGAHAVPTSQAKTGHLGEAPESKRMSTLSAAWACVPSDLQTLWVLQAAQWAVHTAKSLPLRGTCHSWGPAILGDLPSYTVQGQREATSPPLAALSDGELCLPLSLLPLLPTPVPTLPWAAALNQALLQPQNSTVNSRPSRRLRARRRPGHRDGCAHGDPSPL